MVLIHPSVREDQDVRPLLVRPVTGDKKALHRALQRGSFIVEQRDGLDLELGIIHVPDLHQVHAGENGVMDL